MPDIDFEDQVDGDKMKAWILESRRLARKRRRRHAAERMEAEAAALSREVRRWEYARAVEHEEEKEKRRLQLSSSPSSLLPPVSQEERGGGVVLAGDVEHVDIRGVYRRLGKS